jgi:hypothetical protein
MCKITPENVGAQGKNGDINEITITDISGNRFG